MSPRQRMPVGEEAEAFRRQVMQEHANAGYGLITRRTHLVARKGDVYRMLLFCDRFGEYAGNPTGRRTSTRKCGCKYRVDCRLNRETGQWYTVVPPEFGEHNHDPSFEMASPAIRRSSRMGHEEKILGAIRRGDRQGVKSSVIAKDLTERLGVLITQEDIRNIKTKWKQSVATGEASESGDGGDDADDEDVAEVMVTEGSDLDLMDGVQADTPSTGIKDDTVARVEESEKEELQQTEQQKAPAETSRMPTDTQRIQIRHILSPLSQTEDDELSQQRAPISLQPQTHQLHQQLLLHQPSQQHQPPSPRQSPPRQPSPPHLQQSTPPQHSPQQSQSLAQPPFQRQDINSIINSDSDLVQQLKQQIEQLKDFVESQRQHISMQQQQIQNQQQQIQGLLQQQQLQHQQIQQQLQHQHQYQHQGQQHQSHVQPYQLPQIQTPLPSMQEHRSPLVGELMARGW